MVLNIITEDELKKILKPILHLENAIAIKSVIYETLHVRKFKATDKSQYLINQKTTGIKSIYNGFNIEVRRLNDPINDYSGVSVIHFKRKKRFTDHFRNPMKRLVKNLIRICEIEIPSLEFIKFEPTGTPPNLQHEEFYIQRGVLNPNWKEDNKLSPITIFTRQTTSDYLIEFLFTPECYDISGRETTLRDDWVTIFTLFVPNY